MPAPDETLSTDERAELERKLRAGGREAIESMDAEARSAFAEAFKADPDAFGSALDDGDRARIQAEIRARKDAEKAAARRGLGTAGERKRNLALTLRRWYDVASMPLAIGFLLSSHRFHPAYRLSWPRRVALGLKMFRNTRKITTGTSYKAHLAMAAKLFELPPTVEGAVVECGCWKGGSTANISLICDIVGRDLIVYDSFEGLPTAPANDKYAWQEAEGYFRGDLEVVQDNVRRWGAIERCSFRKGLFDATLPHHTEPIVFAFLDVDYASSLHDCMVNLWPHLADEGYVFIDEYTRLDYCALFFSEHWWQTYMDRPPPGMMGVGTGIGVGQFFLGPFKGRPWLHAPTSVAYTRKDFYGMWDYDPDDPAEVDKARGH